MLLWRIFSSHNFYPGGHSPSAGSRPKYFSLFLWRRFKKNPPSPPVLAHLTFILATLLLASLDVFVISSVKLGPKLSVWLELPNQWPGSPSQNSLLRNGVFHSRPTILFDQCQRNNKLYSNDLGHPAFQNSQTVNIVCTYNFTSFRACDFGCILLWSLRATAVFFLNHFFIIIPTLWLFTNVNQLEKAMGTFLIKHLYGMCLFSLN